VNSIVFSIIIPHKNSKESLQFCLDSIPIRNDVQVIVVDDNSDTNNVDFNSFPQWGGKYYECYFTKKGGGAGYARNIGLKHAKGEWVLFADADDFFTDKANAIFDWVLQCTSDIVYARPKSVMLFDRKTSSKRADHYNSLLDDYISTGNETDIRINFWAPWSKFIKLSVVRQHEVCFDEIPYSNDMYFSTKIGCIAKSISVINDYLYVVTESNHSLTSNYGRKKGETFYRSLGLFHSEIVSARYKYTDFNSVIITLRDWYNSNQQLWVAGVICVIKEGYRLPYVIRRIFATKKIIPRIYHSSKASVLLFVNHIQKNVVSKWNEGYDIIS